MKDIKKVSSEWIKEYDYKILDPDGWDRKNYDYSFNKEKITRKEFEQRLAISTISGIAKQGGVKMKNTSVGVSIHNANKRINVLLEKLADIEHKRWSHWQKYLHSKCGKDNNGNLIIPAGYVKNLERLIKTDYKDLTEEEKNSDREVVIKYLRFLL